nr:DUF421 domain-containing protein [Shouchella shacheensis]
MGWEWVWKSALIVVAGTVLLRAAGRKSISQMSLAQVVIMVGIGSLLIQPLSGKNIWSTLFVGALLVLTLIIIEYSQLKFDFIEKLVSGSSKVLIEDGELRLKNLRMVRLTIDQLETQLRQRNVAKISDVKWATIEPNGQIGFVLKEEAKNSTKQDIQTIQEELHQLKQTVENATQAGAPPQQVANVQTTPQNQLEEIIQQITELATELKSSANQEDEDLFSEVKRKSHVVSPPNDLK